MHVKIGGQRWTLRFIPRSLKRKWVGLCRYSNRTITVEKGLTPLKELDTVIHETLHAALPPIDEAFVGETATEMARILWRLGWRKNAQDSQ